MIPCEVCGRPTSYKRCNGCYDFDANIKRILATESGCAYLKQKIIEHNARIYGEVMMRRCELKILGYDVN